MAAVRYESAFARDKKEVTRKVDGKDVTMIRFRAVAKYRVPNPAFVEKPDGKDTRTAAQKRRDVWKQTGTYLEVQKGKGRNAQKQTETNIANELETWRARLNAEASKPAEAKQSVYELAVAYVDRREALSKSMGWDTDTEIANNRVVQRSTVRDWRHTLSFMKSYFSEIAVDDLSILWMCEWEERMLEEGNSKSRVRKAHVLVNQAMNDAVVKEIIKANPVASIRALKLKRGEAKGLNQEGMKRLTALLRSMEPTAEAVGIVLGLHCGLRSGEASGLRWRNVDFAGRTIRVREAVGIADGGAFLKDPKSRSGLRDIYMDDDVFDMLARRCERMLEARDGIEDGFEELFVTGNADGDFLTPTTLSKRFTTLSRAMGLKDVDGKQTHFHSLRHSFASALRAGKGGSERDIRDVMGHASQGVTDSYGTGDVEGQRRAVMAASDYMNPDA